MAARCLNSAVKDLWPRCQMHIHFLWYPQSGHSLNLFFTPLLQSVQGSVPGPCLRRARWILQCSPKQLLSHCSMEPITNHWHVFWPFIVMLWYTHNLGISNRKCPPTQTFYSLPGWPQAASVLSYSWPLANVLHWLLADLHGYIALHHRPVMWALHIVVTPVTLWQVSIIVTGLL